MSDYTKGPWSVGRMLDPKDAPAIIGDEDSVVAILPGKWNHCSYIEADARLIAAAPTMLQELRDILEWALTERAPLRDQEISHIASVIAAATGATP